MLAYLRYSTEKQQHTQKRKIVKFEEKSYKTTINDANTKKAVLPDSFSTK